MNGSEAIQAIESIGSAPGLSQGGAATPASQASFTDILMEGLQEVENKVSTADNLVRRFTIDDDIPIHQVTVALEEARMAVELAVEVRTRLIEGYREIMNMQL